MVEKTQKTKMDQEKTKKNIENLWKQWKTNKNNEKQWKPRTTKKNTEKQENNKKQFQKTIAAAFGAVLLATAISIAVCLVIVQTRTMHGNVDGTVHGKHGQVLGKWHKLKKTKNIKQKTKN